MGQASSNIISKYAWIIEKGFIHVHEWSKLSVDFAETVFSLEKYVIIVYVVPAVCLFVANQNRDTVASALYYKKN